MKKNVVLAALILFSVLNTHAVKLHTFADLVKPLMFELDGRYIYIADQCSILIYDSYNYKLVKTLLKKGSGPQETGSTPKVVLCNEKIYIFSDGIVFIYSKDFKFLKEIKTSMATEIWEIIPIGENYVFPHYSERNNELIEIYSLFDENNAKIKDLTEVPIDQSFKYLISPYVTIASWKTRVFIAQAEKGFFIEVFDERGVKLFTIEKKWDKIKASEKHRQRQKETFLNAIGKLKYEKFRSRGLFEKPLPKYLPDIKDIRVGEDRIYVQTYDIRDDEDKYYILDQKGALLSTLWLPKVYVKKFTFFNDHFYYFRENEDGEGWELHMIKLEGMQKIQKCKKLEEKQL